MIYVGRWHGSATKKNVPEIICGMLYVMSGYQIRLSVKYFKPHTVDFIIPEDTDDPDAIYLGLGHSLSWAYEGRNGEVCGFFVNHKSSIDGTLCGGYVPLGQNEWNIFSQDPLTIYPSVDCNYCNSHGTIINGEWHDDRTPNEFAYWAQQAKKQMKAQQTS